MSEQQGNNNEKKVIAFPDFCESTAERMTRGTLTKEQLQQASEIFAKLFDNFMLEHKAHVSLFEGKRLAGIWDTTILGGQLIVDGQLYSLCLEDKNREDIRQLESKLRKFRDSEIMVQRLVLETLDVTGRSQQNRSYRLGLDNVIRRYDIDNSRTEHIVTDENDPVAATEALMLFGEMVNNNSIQNYRLEEDTGLNNQPVLPEELNSLTEFLDKGVFTAS